MLDQTALVKTAHKLEPLPASVSRLAQLLVKDDWSIRDAEEIISFDQTLTARLLCLANSAASGSRREIATIQDALVRMGTGVVLSMATGSSISRMTKTGLPEYGLEDGALWRHSIAAALAAEAAVGVCETEVPPESITAALLHDIGKLVLLQFLEPDLLRDLREARAHGATSSAAAEMEILGVHHGELGGLIAQHWGLPNRLTNAITHHHAPEDGNDLVCDVVYVANQVAKQVDPGYVVTPEDMTVDPEPQERLKLSSSGLDAMCERVSSRLEAAIAQYEVS